MQDSTEDYLRISKNKRKEIPPKVSPQMLITVQKKKECEARAMKIVEFLLDGKLKEEVFFECLKHIDPSYYQDIVEERAITKLCGYCLCNKRIPDMPKKQYHISTKTNKVYDITDRKNYCSNICYKSSIHIKKQIETSPLWLRKPEETPTFSLLPSNERGVPGEEIDQGVIKMVKNESVFTSVSLFTEASLTEVINNEIKSEKRNEKADNSKVMATIVEDDEENKETVIDVQKTEEIDLKQEDSKLINVNKEEVITNKTMKTENKTKQTTFSEKGIFNSNVKRDILGEIVKHVSEWITLETFIFLHGEDKVKQILNETTLAGYFDKLKVADLQASQKIKYLNMCRKLKLKEIADEKFDRSVNEGKLLPVPDYRQLKEESKDMDLKIRAFYSGNFHEQQVTNLPTQKNKAEEEDFKFVLPLVDSNSQNVLRKKVYLEAVNRTLQKLLPILDLNDREIYSDVQALVKTFNLQSHNTVFKPFIWNVIGVALLRILSIKNANLRTKMDLEKNENYVNLLLNSFINNNKFIENILNIVNNIESYVERYITTND